MSRHVLAGLLLVAVIGCQDKAALEPRAELAQAEGDKKVDARKEPGADTVAEPERKIIYTARIELHVKNLDEARASLDVLLTEVKGYVAKSDESGRTGAVRTGTWKVRVPVAKYHEFLTRVESFGELISKSSDAQDVTEEFVDTEARLKNLKAEEAVLNKLLQEKAQSTADLLAFRKQITSVREDIERYQARLKTLSRLTSLTTIDIVMREDKPFTPDSAPSFGTSIGRTFSDSIDALYSLGKWLVLVLVALAPWSPLILIGLWLIRRPVRATIASFRDAFSSSPPRRRPPPPPRPQGEAQSPDA